MNVKFKGSHRLSVAYSFSFSFPLAFSFSLVPPLTTDSLVQFYYQKYMKVLWMDKYVRLPRGGEIYSRSEIIKNEKNRFLGKLFSFCTSIDILFSFFTVMLTRVLGLLKLDFGWRSKPFIMSIRYCYKADNVHRI